MWGVGCRCGCVPMFDVYDQVPGGGDQQDGRSDREVVEGEVRRVRHQDPPFPAAAVRLRGQEGSEVHPHIRVVGRQRQGPGTPFCCTQKPSPVAIISAREAFSDRSVSLLTAKRGRGVFFLYRRRPCFRSPFSSHLSAAYCTRIGCTCLLYVAKPFSRGNNICQRNLS